MVGAWLFVRESGVTVHSNNSIVKVKVHYFYDSQK